jgi:transposase
LLPTTSQATLDIAVHGRAERWHVVNALPGWRALATDLAAAGARRVKRASKRGWG